MLGDNDQIRKENKVNTDPSKSIYFKLLCLNNILRSPHSLYIVYLRIRDNLILGLGLE